MHFQGAACWAVHLATLTTLGTILQKNANRRASVNLADVQVEQLLVEIRVFDEDILLHCCNKRAQVAIEGILVPDSSDSFHVLFRELQAERPYETAKERLLLIHASDQVALALLRACPLQERWRAFLRHVKFAQS